MQYHSLMDRSTANFGSGEGIEQGNLADRTCKFCGFVLRLKSSMAAHMRRHTGDKPFKCPHCDYRATQRGPLKYHIKAKHPDLPNN